MKNIILGITISGIFVWLALKGVDYEKVTIIVKGLDFRYFPISIVLFMGIMVLRSIRWAIILSPLERLNQRTIFPITCVGYMAISLLPLRLGEFMRPYLVSTKSNVALSSGLATIFIERVLDSLIILFLLFLFIIQSDLPGWLTQAGYSFFITITIVTGVLIVLYLKGSLRDKYFSCILNKFPNNIGEKIKSILELFVAGFSILSNRKLFFYTVILSILVWGLSAVAIFSLYYCQNLPLPLTSAFLVLIVTAIGVSVPTAPGFLGNFQFACILALSIYGIPKDNALVFSMIFYSMTVGFNILMGVILLPFVKLSIEDIKKTIRLQKT